jgi:membrane fusion protein (multidrug efflux system)
LDKKKKVFLGIGLLAVLIAGYFIYDHWIWVGTDNAQIEAHAIMIASKVGGFVTLVNAEEGQVVKKGEILVEIDGRDYQNTLQQVKSELSSLEAKKNDAEKNMRRMAELYKRSAVSTQQFDTSNSGVAEVRSKYEAIAAQVAQAQLNLENTKIKAPADGIIAKKSVEIGQLANPGVPLLGFVEAHDRWVVANFKETDLGGIHLGNEARVNVDALSGRTFKGHVESISPATGATFTLLPPDNATGNFTKVVQRVPVRIKIDEVSDDDILLLRAGLSADVKVKKK